MAGGLDRLNGLSPATAEAELHACCGASRWAREMAARRPFVGPEEMFAAADQVCRSLSREDWLEAFAHHPQIGETRAERQADDAIDRQLSSCWSALEQSVAQQASAAVAERLAEGNRAYRERFGYIFIVCATGKTAQEMLAILERRLQNDPATELAIAAEEQRRITRLRLEKLLAAVEPER